MKERIISRDCEIIRTISQECGEEEDKDYKIQIERRPLRHEMDAARTRS